MTEQVFSTHKTDKGFVSPIKYLVLQINEATQKNMAKRLDVQFTNKRLSEWFINVRRALNLIGDEHQWVGPQFVKIVEHHM